MGDEEQRKSPRVPRAFIVRYRCPDAGMTGWLISPLRDLSSGGARFISEQPFTDGTVLEVQLILPVAKDPVCLKAKVAWTAPARLGMVETGVIFEPGGAAAEQAISDAVAQFLNRPGRR